MGFQQSTFALFGIGLGPIIATQLLVILPSWRWVFAIMVIPGLILAFLIWRTIREPEELQEELPTDQLPEETTPPCRGKTTPSSTAGLMYSDTATLSSLLWRCAAR